VEPLVQVPWLLEEDATDEIASLLLEIPMSLDKELDCELSVCDRLLDDSEISSELATLLLAVSSTELLDDAALEDSCSLLLEEATSELSVELFTLLLCVELLELSIILLWALLDDSTTELLDSWELCDELEIAELVLELADSRLELTSDDAAEELLATEELLDETTGQPLASTICPAGVLGQSSSGSTTPSKSESLTGVLHIPVKSALESVG
jgi:hypothetical protein